MTLRGLMGRWVRPGAVDAAVEEWIGWSLPPADLAMRESGWQPDEPTAYCGRCGESVGDGEATDGGCARCRGRRLPIGQTIRLGSYAGPLRRWVVAVKYECWWEMADALGRLLGAGCRDPEAGDAAICVVPMPMPWQRRLYRGIDHTRTIADGVASSLGAAASVMPVLSRRNGPPQTSLSPTERRRHGPRGLGIRRAREARLAIEGSRVILVDDVRTTGASSEAAARLLRTLRPKTLTAAFAAVADGPGRRVRIP